MSGALGPETTCAICGRRTGGLRVLCQECSAPEWYRRRRLLKSLLEGLCTLRDGGPLRS